MQFRFGGTVLRTNTKGMRGRGILFLLIMGGFVITTVYFLHVLSKDDDFADVDAIENINSNGGNGNDVVVRWGVGKQSKEKLKGYLSAMDPLHLKYRDLAIKENNNDQNETIFAMYAARKIYGRILKRQQHILKTQNRPPDKRYNINVTLSDTISMDRKIKDTRPKICGSFTYDTSSLPKASVVIIFYNEALSMLLRTVHSILNQTPDHLLGHVILVDDLSSSEYLQEKFAKYIDMLPKTKLIRNTKREGLIRSRMIGAAASESEVVVFLDAHTEANVGWLEPMLYELQLHPNTIVQPFVDGIDSQTIEYSAPVSIYKGSFSWDLRYTWLRVPDHITDQVFETGLPYFSPTLVGCAIAVNKKYFYDIGAFDEGLKVWGGENIELAFRAWMCGGRVVTVPCSRVGHVFKNFPYKFDGDRDSIVQKNLMRVADTWMDSYSKYFYASTRIYDFKRIEFTEEEKRSLLPRKDLRKRLNCKSFDWYLHNIIPEVDSPPMDSVFYGEIMSLRSRACFEVADDGYIIMNYYCYEHKIIPNNNFRINEQGLLMYKSRCVTYNAPRPSLYVTECPTHDLDKFSLWELKQVGHTWGMLKTKKRNSKGIMEHWCVVQVTNVLPEHKGAQMPQITGLCDEHNQFQTWIFTYRFDFSLVI